MLAVASGAIPSSAATFTVINTNGNGAGSFEQAILDANASLDADDTIEFDIPGGGVPTIVDSLPAVTGPVLIDGTTQTAGIVELQNGGGTALSITGSGSTVRGLVINSSSTGVSLGPAAGNNTITGCGIGTDPTGTAADANQTGVFIQGSNNTVANNLIAGNTLSAINIQGTNNVVTGNVIGLDVTQTLALGGSTGIIINTGTNNRIGGTGAVEGNVIAGLAGTGISLQNATAAGNMIQGNRIGTNATNASGLGVSVGVAFASVTGAGNVVGGATAEAGNLIVAASSNGVAMTNSSNATIQGNMIGTAALPNASNGMDLAGSGNNTIEDNVISGNGAAGINLRSGADGNTIRGNEISGNNLGISVSGGQMDRFTENSIHDNDGLGIDLGVNGVTENDPLDVDVAPGLNDAQNFPVLSMVSASEVTGSLNSTANTEFTVEFFATPSCDASGNGEGQTFLGAVQATTDGSGDADLTFPLPAAAAGQVITATATAPDGDTSEFSDCTGTVPTTTTTTSPQPTTTSTTSTTTTSTAPTSTTAATTTTVPTTTSTTTSSTSTTSTSTPTTTSTTSATSSSTTSTSSSTTSSSAAPATTSSSTTSTTLGDPCAAEPVGPTFRSLNCRLAALLAQVNAASDLGSFQARLRRLLERAKERKEQAEVSCGEPDPRRTNTLLKQALRKMTKVRQTLRSLRARKSLPTVLREELLEAADGLRVDFRTLRARVRCPDDAG